MMVRISSAYTTLVLSIFVFGLSEGSWLLSNPFEELFHPRKSDENLTLNGSSNPPASPVAPAEVPSPPPAGDPPRPDVRPPPPAIHPPPPAPQPNIDLAAEMRRIIKEEMKKLQSSQSAPPAIPSSKPAPAGDTAEMIRKVIAEELSKALPTTTTTAPVTTSKPSPLPVWMSWANAKSWAKKPGPNGQAPPGFIGTLQGRYGPPEANIDAAHPAGSPGWVWSQIASKWAKDPTAVPPAQVVDKGNWEVVLPPQALPKN